VQLAPTYMHYSQESLASWATIVGAIVSVLALIQSRTWLVLISLLFVCVSVVVGIYGQRNRLAIDAASIKVEGHSIDSLNIANLRRRVNRSLVIQEAHHTALIHGEDLSVSWKYTGYCKTDRTSAMDFSIDSDSSTPFEKLDCWAYDLGHDPAMSYKIRPFLIGPEGASKKISVPFLEPLTAQQSFGMLLKCALPECVKAGFGYYTSTLSFSQERVGRYTTRLTFIGRPPEWLRAYEYADSGEPGILKNLSPILHAPALTEYLDEAENIPGQTARIYVFWRSPES